MYLNFTQNKKYYNGLGMPTRQLLRQSLQDIIPQRYTSDLQER